MSNSTFACEFISGLTMAAAYLPVANCLADGVNGYRVLRKAPVVHIGTEFWFAAQVSPQHETTVATILDHKGYQRFVPTYMARRQWSDRIKLIEKPLFEGYVFCRMTEQSFGLVRTTPGVVRLVGFNGWPSPVPEDEIFALQKLIQSGIRAYPIAMHLKVGQRVEVTTGPLAGITGTFDTD
jgi:transcription antitermination factor NusG